MNIVLGPSAQSSGNPEVCGANNPEGSVNSVGRSWIGNFGQTMRVAAFGLSVLGCDQNSQPGVAPGVAPAVGPAGASSTERSGPQLVPSQVGPQPVIVYHSESVIVERSDEQLKEHQRKLNLSFAEFPFSCPAGEEILPASEFSAATPETLKVANGALYLWRSAMKEESALRVVTALELDFRFVSTDSANLSELQSRKIFSASTAPILLTGKAETAAVTEAGVPALEFCNVQNSARFFEIVGDFGRELSFMMRSDGQATALPLARFKEYAEGRIQALHREELDLLFVAEYLRTSPEISEQNRKAYLDVWLAELAKQSLVVLQSRRALELRLQVWDLSNALREVEDGLLAVANSTTVRELDQQEREILLELRQQLHQFQVRWEQDVFFNEGTLKLNDHFGLHPLSLALENIPPYVFDGNAALANSFQRSLQLSNQLPMRITLYLRSGRWLHEWNSEPRPFSPSEDKDKLEALGLYYFINKNK